MTPPPLSLPTATSERNRSFHYNRAFAIGISLNLGFVVVEGGWGILARSLALLADASHNLSDVLSLLLAWGANLLAGQKPTAHRTYGLRRATILAALLSTILLLMVLGAIAGEAIDRLNQSTSLSGMTLIAVAGIGLVINAVTALLFMSGRKHDLNIKGAYLHMIADAGVSLGVVLAGLAIMATGWSWLDPSISLVIVAVILVGTWALLRDSLNLAVDAVPRKIDPIAVEGYLLGLPGVVELHDLHIWGMSTTEVALTVHLVMPQRLTDDGFLHTLAKDLRDRFGIEHTTMQIEQGDSEYSCEQAYPGHV